MIRGASLVSRGARTSRFGSSVLRTVVQSQRFSSRGPSSSSKATGSGQTPPPPPSSPPPQDSGSPKGKILLGMGAVALVSTIAASLYNKDDPKSALEPTSSKPAFPEGSVSIIFVLGGPGSGKGTQCANLVKDHGFIHLSAGDLLRAEQKREGSKFGALIDKCIREGEIVPQEVTIALLKQAIVDNNAKGATKFLIDGFPRKMDQALTFEEEVAKASFTLFFECPETVMLTRLLERGKTSGRTDDNVESIKKRFRTFIETSMPVIDMYETQGRVIKVRCDHPIDQVYDEVKSALKDKGI